MLIYNSFGLQMK